MATDRGSRLVKALEQVLTRREREKAPVRTARVVGRNPDGTTQVQRADAQCVSRGGATNAYAGEYVVEPARSTFSRRGTAGVAPAAEAGAVRLLWVERLEPNRYRPGAEYSVVVTGRGFTPTTELQFLRPYSWDANLGISINGATWIDDEHFELAISVAADAVLCRSGAPLAYFEPGTTYRRRKERAYSIDLVLEPRLAHLQGAPFAVAWDLYLDRLVYDRWDWHYTVIAGTEPPVIYDQGRVDTVLCALSSADGPLTDVAQGRVLALISTEAATPSPEAPEPLPDRIVEQIAVDPVTGSIVVYSHRDSVEVPYYVTDIHTFDALGGPMGSASHPQPNDDYPRWVVPHVIAHGLVIYAVERSVDGPTGRVVRRTFGVLGAGGESLPSYPGNEWERISSVALDPPAEGNEDGTLYILSTTLYDPGEPTAHTRSGMAALNGSTLALLAGYSLDFGHGGAEPYAWSWDAGAGPNTGGYLLFDGADEAGPRFISVGYDPGSYDPAPGPDALATFRFSPADNGQLLESLGPPLPTPLHRTATGILGCLQGTLPPEVIEITPPEEEP